MENISKKALSDKLIEKLDIVFATAKTRDFFIKDAEFQRLIGKQILILGYLGMTAEADRYKEQATTASKAFEMPKYTAPTTIEDAADEINFLDIYIKNTFKKDLIELRDDDIKAKANPQPQQPTPVAGAVPGMNPNQQGQQGGYGPGMGRQNPFMNPFMGGGGYGPNMRPHPLQDPTFYPYTRKPKYMPLCRNLLGVMFLLLALAEIVIVIAQAVNKDTVVGHYIITGNPDPQPISYNYANNLIIPIILTLFLAYWGYTYLRPTKFDRVKYRVNAASAIVMLVMFGLLNIVSDFWISSAYNVLTQKDAWMGIAENINNNRGTNIEFLFAAVVTFYSLCLATILFAVIVQYFNPPVDQEKVMTASQEWFEQVQGGNPNDHGNNEN